MSRLVVWMLSVALVVTLGTSPAVAQDKYTVGITGGT